MKTLLLGLMLGLGSTFVHASNSEENYQWVDWKDANSIKEETK